MNRKYLALYVFLGMSLFPVIITSTSTSDISAFTVNATIHTISYNDIPLYGDKLITENALMDSVSIWNDLNDHIYFVVVESNADVNISWVDKLDNNDLGVYIAFLNNNGEWYDHNISISLGTYGCDSTYHLYSYVSLRETIMHEMGHYLGLEHIDDMNHLMYSPESIDVYSTDTYDDMNYIIPQVINYNFETTAANDILDQIHTLSEKVHILDDQSLNDNTISNFEHAQNQEELRQKIYDLDIMLVCMQTT